MRHTVCIYQYIHTYSIYVICTYCMYTSIYTYIFRNPANPFRRGPRRGPVAHPRAENPCYRQIK